MPLALRDVKMLIKLLGPQGAVAGLVASDLETAQLSTLVKEAKVDINEPTGRELLVALLVTSLARRELKSMDDLIKMTYDQLVAHFEDVSPTNNELIKVMTLLGYKVSAEDRKHLRKSVARQLSETALFANVALQVRNKPENQ
jgi:hypothetical protein